MPGMGQKKIGASQFIPKSFLLHFKFHVRNRKRQKLEAALIFREWVFDTGSFTAVLQSVFTLHETLPYLVVCYSAV